MALGRGLDDLLSDSDDDALTHNINLTKIEVDPNQPRKRFDEETISELADSIRKQGLLQPIIIRPIEDSVDKYRIVVGERRFRAVSSLGWKTIPAIVRTDLDDRSAAIISLVENIQREEVDFWDQASALRDLTIKYNMSVSDASMVLGRKKRWGYQVLRIFDTPPRVQELVASKKINGWVASELSALSEEDPEKAIELAEALAENSSLRNMVLAYVKSTRTPNSDQVDGELAVPSIEEPEKAIELAEDEADAALATESPSFGFEDGGSTPIEVHSSNGSVTFGEIDRDLDEEDLKFLSEDDDTNTNTGEESQSPSPAKNSSAKKEEKEEKQLSSFDQTRIASAAKDLTQIWGVLVEIEADGDFEGAMKFHFSDSKAFEELFLLLSNSSPRMS